MAPAWQEISDQVAAACAPAGFDLLQPFRLDWYNDAIAPAYRLPDLGRPRGLGLLIGHTRALWSPFLAALRADAALAADPDPLERYSVDVVRAALRPLAPRWEARWSHEAEPRRVAMQRLGHLSGLAHLADCHLNIHPVYGPWIALRAAVAVDVDGPPGPPPNPANPCSACVDACRPAFDRAIATLAARDPAQPGLGDAWPLWLALRDACPLGREHRYSEAQIAYHYRSDRAALR